MFPLNYKFVKSFLFRENARDGRTYERGATLDAAS